MNRTLRITLKTLMWALLGLIAVVVALLGLLTAHYCSADMRQPDVAIDTADFKVENRVGYNYCNGIMIRLNDKRLFELYLTGDAMERGVAHGRLSEELLRYQEDVFVDQIMRIVPSKSYLGFLRFLLLGFNRDLGEHVTEEYRREIYGVSLSGTHEYDAIGTSYERQLNYHAAHDIGHAMQEYMLVGCSSFGVWDDQSADSTLLIGRNFDFWVGDDFARYVVVSFVAPEQGYKFASVGWAGMTGVLSGMNEKGLTVTLNAAKGAIPRKAATPISLLAREILQYASNIEQAWEIAQSRQTFVSESLLIGSAEDGRAVVIEKSPEAIHLYESTTSRIVSTNHYQSEGFAQEKNNVENIASSDSPYRLARVNELLDSLGSCDVEDAAFVLRNRYGIRGKDIGLTNEKSINQFIAHHSVIFQPEKLRMWVSTAPWQMGEFICYDLRSIFENPDFGGELYDPALTIAQDKTLIGDNVFDKVMIHRTLTGDILGAVDDGGSIHEHLLERYLYNNYELWETHYVLGRYRLAKGQFDQARERLHRALECEIPRTGQRRDVEKLLNKVPRK